MMIVFFSWLILIQKMVSKLTKLLKTRALYMSTQSEGLKKIIWRISELLFQTGVILQRSKTPHTQGAPL